MTDENYQKSPSKATPYKTISSFNKLQLSQPHQNYTSNKRRQQIDENSEYLVTDRSELTQSLMVKK